MKNLIEVYKSNFDYILLDAPAGIETGFMLSLKCAEECIIVSTPDPVSIRAASNAANLIRKNGVKELRLVLNRFNKKQHKKFKLAINSQEEQAQADVPK